MTVCEEQEGPSVQGALAREKLCEAGASVPADHNGPWLAVGLCMIYGGKERRNEKKGGSVRQKTLRNKVLMENVLFL